MKTSQILLRSYANAGGGSSMSSLHKEILEYSEQQNLPFHQLLFESEAYGLMQKSSLYHGFDSVHDMVLYSDNDQCHSIWAFAILSALSEE